MDVSIIIVNYNTVKWIIDLIDSIIKKSIGFSYEIIIVDNNSTDNSKGILKKQYDDTIIFLELSDNIGFGCANNKGLRIAKGRNILFLNPDTILINNAIKILSDFLDNNPDVGIVGGNLYTSDYKPSYSFNRYITGFLTEELSLLTLGISNYFFRNLHFNNSNNPMNVGSISGADLMIPRKILDKVGHFDPQFFMYYEDTDLNYRVKKAGYKIMNIPEAKISHYESQSFDCNEMKLKYSTESRVKFYTKSKSKIYCKTVTVLRLLIININIFLLTIFQRNKAYYTSLKKIEKECLFDRAEFQNH